MIGRNPGVCQRARGVRSSGRRSSGCMRIIELLRLASTWPYQTVCPAPGIFRTSTPRQCSWATSSGGTCSLGSGRMANDRVPDGGRCSMPRREPTRLSEVVTSNILAASASISQSRSFQWGVRARRAGVRLCLQPPRQQPHDLSTPELGVQPPGSVGRDGDRRSDRDVVVLVERMNEPDSPLAVSFFEAEGSILREAIWALLTVMWVMRRSERAGVRVAA